MNLVDVVIVSIIVIGLCLIIYFNFIKKDRNSCGKCPYKKDNCSCNKK